MLHSGGRQERDDYATLGDSNAVLATLASASQGHAEENRGSADCLFPLCKTWLDFADKEVETIKDMGKTDPIRLVAAGMCAGFVVGVLETLRSNKQSCPPRTSVIRNLSARW